MDPDIRYLLSLSAIRQRASIVGDAAKAGNLTHFDLNLKRLDDVADFVASVIQVCSVVEHCSTLSKMSANYHHSVIMGRIITRRFLRMVVGNISK